MTIELPPFVPFIDGAAADWKERAQHYLDDGFNFFVLLCSGAAADLAEIVGQLPAPETRATLLSTARFLDQREFRLPEKTSEGLEKVFHVEQLSLPRTRPPVVKLYLLYCHIRGIVSQHELPSDARVACDAYNNDRFARAHFPEAAVYRWENDEWRRTRLC